MLMHFVLQQAPRANGEDDQKEPEVDESVADDDDPEQELNVSTVGSMYIYSVAHFIQLSVRSVTHLVSVLRSIANSWPRSILSLWMKST